METLGEHYAILPAKNRVLIEMQLLSVAFQMSKLTDVKSLLSLYSLDLDISVILLSYQDIIH